MFEVKGLSRSLKFLHTFKSLKTCWFILFILQLLASKLISDLLLGLYLCFNTMDQLIETCLVYFTQVEKSLLSLMSQVWCIITWLAHPILHHLHMVVIHISSRLGLLVLNTVLETPTWPWWGVGIDYGLECREVRSSFFFHGRDREWRSHNSAL